MMASTPRLSHADTQILLRLERRAREQARTPLARVLHWVWRGGLVALVVVALGSAGWMALDHVSAVPALVVPAEPVDLAAAEVAGPVEVPAPAPTVATGPVPVLMPMMIPIMVPVLVPAPSASPRLAARAPARKPKLRIARDAHKPVRVAVVKRAPVVKKDEDAALLSALLSAMRNAPQEGGKKP